MPCCKVGSFYLSLVFSFFMGCSDSQNPTASVADSPSPAADHSAPSSTLSDADRDDANKKPADSQPVDRPPVPVEFIAINPVEIMVRYPNGAGAGALVKPQFDLVDATDKTVDWAEAEKFKLVQLYSPLPVAKQYTQSSPPVETLFIKPKK